MIFLQNFLALTTDNLTIKGALRLLKELTFSETNYYPMLDHEVHQVNFNDSVVCCDPRYIITNQCHRSSKQFIRQFAFYSHWMLKFSNSVLPFCSIDLDREQRGELATFFYFVPEPTTSTCACIHVYSFETPTEDSEIVQSLLLVKYFSQDEEARRYIPFCMASLKLILCANKFCPFEMHSLVSEALQSLGVKRKQPDPGSWTVRQVSFWMENKLVRAQLGCVVKMSLI